MGDDLLDVYRALLAEIYDALGAAGFNDLPQAATTVFRDIDGRGSLPGDLAAGAGMAPDAMRAVLDRLVAGGYVEWVGDRVRPAERGHAAFAAGRQALAEVDERWSARVGPERFAVFREVLAELAR